jgi:hypothetical protein
MEESCKTQPKKEKNNRKLNAVSVTKKLISGDESQSDNRVDFVVVGDGFTAAD